ncbi:MAG TPA: hypothetical protein VF981_17925 [Gemmatimonadaceae bacterium]
MRRSRCQVFLLSPANCAGKRAGYLLGGSGSPLAQRLRSAGAPIGEIFSFMSALYFRGKLAYARAFARPPAGWDGVQVIVPGRGLCPACTVVDLAALRDIASVAVDLENPRYTEPLLTDAGRLASQLRPSDSVVLLGSIATPKYVVPLSAMLGDRLHCPAEFVGMGDMSRGSLMLRRASEGQELVYIRASVESPTVRVT